MDVQMHIFVRSRHHVLFDYPLGQSQNHLLAAVLQVEHESFIREEGQSLIRLFQVNTENAALLLWVLIELIEDMANANRTEVEIQLLDLVDLQLLLDSVIQAVGRLPKGPLEVIAEVFVLINCF